MISRQFLATAGAGFGTVALHGMLAESLQASSLESASTGLHHRARAKSVIFLFMEGGPSQLDTFDRKPLLNELAGQPLPASFKEPLTSMRIMLAIGTAPFQSLRSKDIACGCWFCDASTTQLSTEPVNVPPCDRKQ